MPVTFVCPHLQHDDVLSRFKANLHWDVARSSRARFFVCFIAPRSCRAEPCTSAELPDATKQRITPGNSWHVVSVDWPLLL